MLVVDVVGVVVGAVVVAQVGVSIVHKRIIAVVVLLVVGACAVAVKTTSLTRLM